jgi:hypothetical protein
VHEQWVIELFGSLSGAEKEQAGRLLAKLKLGLGSQPVTQTENTGKR